MILSADSINGVLTMPDFQEAEGYQIENEAYFFNSLSDLRKNIVSDIKSLRELINIHKVYGIKRY